MDEENLLNLITAINGLTSNISAIITNMTPSWTSIASLIIQAVMLLGLGLSLRSIYLSSKALAISTKQLTEAMKQSQENHDARRRENTVSILKDWHSTQDAGTRFLAKKLVKLLSKEDKQSLIESKPFVIGEELLPLIQTCVCPKIKKCSDTCDDCSFVFSKETLENDKKTIKKSIITLKPHAVITLRQIVVSYLNLLETIASGYRNNIIDRDIIKEQLSYLSRTEENFLSMLNEFNLNDDLPCISFMIQDMQGIKQEGKKPLGV